MCATRLALMANGQTQMEVTTLSPSPRSPRVALRPGTASAIPGTTVRADVDDRQFLEQVHNLALDCVNQGGISNLQVIRIADDEW